MTWEILDTTRGDVVGVFSSSEEAASSLAAYLAEHADQAGDLAVATVDDTGCAVHVTPGAELLARGAIPAG